IQCESRNCRFSLFHPAACRPPQCLQTCAQYKKFPEQYSPHINSYCPACIDYQQKQAAQARAGRR
ncbi:hypothetical protein BDZ89DRAFT_954920, partial [Hymenopellis radicata]